MMEQIIEYLVITFIILGGIVGLYQGFVTIFFSWFSVVLGGILAFNFSYGLTKTFFPNFLNNIFVIFLIGVIIFAITFIIISSLGRTFSNTLDKFRLGILNYLLGGIFGVAQMLVIVGLCIYWLGVLGWVNMQAFPVSMFSAYWAERIIILIGTQVPMATKLL